MLPRLFLVALPLLVVLLLTGGCSTTPKLDSAGVDRNITPTLATQNIDVAKGKRAMWGGMILSGKNMPESTQLEVLAYPLGEDDRPNRDAQPMGRFIAKSEGYIETAEYASGRLLTVVGTVEGLRHGKIGQSEYTYPVIDIQQKHLWEQPASSSRPRDSNVHFNFGLGVIFH